SLHFVPSTHARDNLLAEGVEESDIQLVGNTVIDNLFHYISSPPSANARTVLITLHRRTFCEAERHQYLAYFERLISANPQYRFRWLQHPSQPLSELVPAHPNLQFLDPLPFLEMLRQYQDTCLIFTDSGGVQEEAAYLGIPCIVARKMTERQESLEAGVSKLIDLRQRDIPQILANFESEKLLFRNPLYGGGDSATQVVDACLNYQIYD
ncbi:MAG: UDP-N-acetylglucosamine 2-epimerase, partial [Bacteroidota bacterium]